MLPSIVEDLMAFVAGHSSRSAHCWPPRARLSSNASIMANVLQIADALYAEDRDAKTLAQRVASKLESDGVTNLPLLTQENYATGRAAL